MIVYIYINASFSVLPTLTFPHCVHKYKFSTRFIAAIFLDSIYMCYYTILVFLTYFTVCKRL